MNRLRIVPVPKETCEWLTQRTGAQLTPDVRAIAAVTETGRIVGMVCYHSWTENAVTAHVAVDSPAAVRALLEPAFSYPFEQAGRGVLLGAIAQSNTRSLRLAKRLGFKEAHRVKDGRAVGDDLVFVEMRREECRWLKRQRKAA